jgi:excisionase family DNA binding protein
LINTDILPVEQLLTPAEVAGLCKVSRRTVYSWIERGEFKDDDVFKLGTNQVRVTTSGLAKFLKGRRINAV